MARKTSYWLLFIAVLAMLPLFHPSSYLMQLVNQSLIFAIVVLGLNFITGYTGQINFGQAAFYGIGAYTTALMTTAGYSFWLALPASALAAALFSVVLGIPTLRLRTYYLAMATIGFGEIVQRVLIHWQELTNGTSGIRGIPGIRIGGYELAEHWQYYLFILGVLSLLVVVALRVRNSRFGRDMIAARDSEIAAELSGVNTFSAKMLALVLAAVYAGIGGALNAAYSSYVSPDQYTGQQAVLFFTMLVFGGTGSTAGAIVGAISLTFLPEVLRFLKEWYMVVYGVGVIAVIILMPKGVIGIAQRLAPAIQRRLLPRRSLKLKAS